MVLSGSVLSASLLLVNNHELEFQRERITFVIIIIIIQFIRLAHFRFVLFLLARLCGHHAHPKSE